MHKINDVAHTFTCCSRIEYASCHFAVMMNHTDDAMSVFWDSLTTARFLRSHKKVAKYPLMGLAEVGNVTSSCPEVICLPKLLSAWTCFRYQTSSVLSAWPARCRREIHLTYAQAYTPLTKALDNKRPFCDHPYLVSALLGREYVASTPSFRHFHECTHGMKEIR